MNIRDLANIAYQATNRSEKITIDQHTQQISTIQVNWKDKLVYLLRNIPLLNRLAPCDEQNIYTQALFLKSLTARYGQAAALTSIKNYTAYFRVDQNTHAVKPLKGYVVTNIINEAKNAAIEKLQARYPQVESYAVEEALNLQESDPEGSEVLTQEEFVALFAYTGPYYRDINNSLRANDKDQLTQWQNVIDDAKSGLQKLEATALKGKSGLVFRGLQVGKRNPYAKLEDFAEGNTVKDAAFVSTSTNPYIARGFAGIRSPHQTSTEGPMLLHIFAGKGKGNIAPLSASPHEAEILLPPGVEFTVEFREYDEKNQIFKAVLKNKNLPSGHGQQGYVDALTDTLKAKGIPLNTLHKTV